MKHSDWHQKYADSVRWRVTPAGIEIEPGALIEPTPGQRVRTAQYIRWCRPAFEAAAICYGVPIDLLLACALTESSADNPATPLRENEMCVREEPGFVADERTPHRVSAGLCQLLLSTARATMKDSSIDRGWLLVPENSIRACASYMHDLEPKTEHDPILTACAYNAGGLYRNSSPENRWKLRQYPIGTSKHADRFAEYFAAGMQAEAEFSAPSFHELLDGYGDRTDLTVINPRSSR